MPKLVFNIQFGKNEGLVLSPSDLQNLYLAGIPLCYPSGARISEELIKQKIKSSQKYFENILSIKLLKQKVIEEQDYNRQEHASWGYIRTVFPINEPIQLSGKINNVIQITYPKSWLSVKDSTDTTSFRNMYILPNTKDGDTTTIYHGTFSGIWPSRLVQGSNNIPNYWDVSYCSGWGADDLPADLMDAIGKMSAIQVLAIAGDLIYGAGIGNQSIAIDGISQTYSTTKGGGKGAFSGRIDQYQKELEQAVKDLKSEYLGIMFRVV